MDILLFINIDDSKIFGSNRENHKKLSKSDFIKALHRVEKPSFQISNNRKVFTQFKQTFTKALIL